MHLLNITVRNASILNLKEMAWNYNLKRVILNMCRTIPVGNHNIAQYQA